MGKIIVVGSGASGVHFALSMLKKGYEVTMLDVGHTPEPMVNPEDTFDSLKEKLSDPVRYFLGKGFESVIYPDNDSEYYGFPPVKEYIFTKPDNFIYKTEGFEPIFSFARGGLAEAWTAGSYPFNDHELKDFPFTFKDIEPYYSEVAARIGIIGTKDDTACFFPLHKNLLPPFELDPHSSRILEEYKRQKFLFNNLLGCYIGRTRVATLSCDKDDRKGCSFHGRCLWGCPQKSLYTPSITLGQCLRYSNFKYIPGIFVTHFIYNSDRIITSVAAESYNKEAKYRFKCDKLALAAGTLCSSKIFLESFYRNEGIILKLQGLMDNRQVLMPFLNLKMIGKSFNPESYQYHRIAIGFKGEKPEEFIHGQLTTLKTALVHPIIQSLPMDLKSAIFLFKNIHAALGVVNVNFFDKRRKENYVTMAHDKGSSSLFMKIRYSPPSDESMMIKKEIKRVRKALGKLWCIAPSVMTHIRPMGASVHYSGTIPMSETKKSLTCSPSCRSNDFENLYLVDGTTFPFLPAKNLTFTLMANAVRVADNM